VFNAAYRRLGMARLPFSVFRREGRRFYYVQFKGAKGEYLPAISTKQTSEADAIETSFKWLREGRPSGNGGSISISLQETLRQVKTELDADFICRELKRQGLLKTYVITNSKQAVDFPAYLQNFWDFDNSLYVKEKLRKNHGIHRNYTIGQRLSAEKYWSPFFVGRFLGDITRQDIEEFMDDLSRGRLSAGRKNSIIRAGVIPLRWAFAKEVIDKDVTAGITWFAGKSAERQIFSPEIVQTLLMLNGRTSVPVLPVCWPP
jgi:hypothetical protein